MVAATGVWSQRIKEANERNGKRAYGTNPNGLAYASAFLVAVVGLGIRMKLRMVRTFAWEAYEVVHGERLRNAQNLRAKYGRKADEQFQQEYAREHAKQQARAHGRAQHQRARAEARSEAAGARGEDPLDRHRAVLGVARGARKAELKAAYYAAAKRHHPDARNAKQAAAAEFRDAREAYDTLLRHADA